MDAVRVPKAACVPKVAIGPNSARAVRNSANAAAASVPTGTARIAGPAAKAGAISKDRDRGEAREWIDPKERRGQADPNSPFAKLAALKAQLEGSK
jgi:hypothetical protein